MTTSIVQYIWLLTATTVTPADRASRACIDQLVRYGRRAPRREEPLVAIRRNGTSTTVVAGLTGHTTLSGCWLTSLSTRMTSSLERWLVCVSRYA
ncbi:hypothetical protein EDB83DRAFT_1403311 [Lactarius deliciosus]|nr:hypothetical protein EDB83DRAFT_1403311 [Lactarius deliciosus]